MTDGYGPVLGAPGAGKTDTLVKLGWLLQSVRHKILVGAPNNGTVDHDAIRMYNARPKGSKAKMLWLETNGLETAGLTKFQDYEEITDPSRPLSVKKEHDALEDNAYYNAVLAACVSGVAASEEQLDARQKRTKILDAQETAYLELAQGTGPQDFELQKDLPAELTLFWRVEELLTEDNARAEAEHAAEVSEIEQDNGPPQAAEKKNALGPALNRSKSHEYQHFLAKFQTRGGYLPKKSSDRFAELRKEIIRRVLQATHFFFVTFNNAGSEIVEGGFPATVLLLDEAGQATIPRCWYL